MKKILFVITLLIFTISAYGQSMLDKPAALLKLTQTEIISSKKVNQTILLVEQNEKRVLSEEEKRSILNSMIDSALVVQAAQEENIIIPKEQVKQIGIVQLSQNLGRQISESEFKQIVEVQTKQPLDVYLLELEKQLLVQKYVAEKGKNDFNSISPPSDREIYSKYKEQEMSFVNGEMMRVSHIYFSYVIQDPQNPRIMNSSEKEEVRIKAESVFKDIKNGISTFEESVRTSSEDTNSKLNTGDIGFIVRNDPNPVQLFGPDFVNQIFDMEIGDHRLVESIAGYHIVKTTDYIDKKFLKLDDQVSPLEQKTVRDFISERLFAVKQQETFNLVGERLVEELRNKAEITLYLENLGW